MASIAARFSRASILSIRSQICRSFTTCQPLRQTTIPYTPTCPAPTCECASTPPGLDIDRKAPLLNTKAAYAQQVLLCTGKDDWQSNIEQEEGATSTFVKGVKSVIGKGGPGFDPFNSVSIIASSFPESSAPNTSTALLFPAFKRISAIPHTSDAFNAFATAYLKAQALHPMHDNLNDTQRSALLRNEALAPRLPAAEDITTPTILICGHGGRDQRCGIMGPLLRDAFIKETARRGIEAQVGVISHIGGHKYAGNVIVYVPPNMTGNALAGAGIWYGRVGPEHVEGLVDETVVKGRVVGELLRGGVLKDGGDVGRIVERQLAGDKEEGGLRLRPRARGTAST